MVENYTKTYLFKKNLKFLITHIISVLKLHTL